MYKYYCLQGDGGSPLVCYDRSKGAYVQAGIVSWGIGCGSELPAAYVDVSRYVQWIDENISRYFNLRSSYYDYNWLSDYTYTTDNYNTCKRNLYNQDYNQYTFNHKCNTRNLIRGRS